MSILKMIKAQLGLSATPANNFTFDAGDEDGTMWLSRGNAGAPTQDVMKVAADGSVSFPATPDIHRPVLTINSLPITTLLANYAATPLLFAAAPFNPLDMYSFLTGEIFIKEDGLYRIAGTIRVNNPGVSEPEAGAGLDVALGAPSGMNEFRPLLVGWGTAETLFVPFSATYLCAAGDRFIFNGYGAAGNGCTIGGGNPGNSQIMVTRIG